MWSPLTFSSVFSRKTKYSQQRKCKHNNSRSRYAATYEKKWNQILLKWDQLPWIPNALLMTFLVKPGLVTVVLYTKEINPNILQKIEKHPSQVFYMQPICSTFAFLPLTLDAIFLSVLDAVANFCLVRRLKIWINKIMVTIKLIKDENEGLKIKNNIFTNFEWAKYFVCKINQ